jgi:hypothetical protein
MARMRNRRGRAWLVAATAAAGAAMVALAAPAASAAPASPTWHVVKSVKTNQGVFTEVVATGKTSGWAFGGQFSTLSADTAWRRSSATWTQDKAFPGKKNETVVTAGANSPSDVWAFASQINGVSRVLHYNGKAWSVAKTFGAQIGGASVAGKNDIWVFGADFFGMPALGAWHFNGHTWKLTGKGLQGGSALSATNAWAFSGTKVYHYNGSKWAGTNLKSLLPAKQQLNFPAVTGIIALSATNVYAIGNGNLQDEGGPTVILHFNGAGWKKVASSPKFGYGSMSTGGSQQISTDGKGGLWLPYPGVDGQKSFMLHFAGGKLTPVALPGNPLAISVVSVSRIPGTGAQLASGSTFKAAQPGVNQVAVILQFS